MAEISEADWRDIINTLIAEAGGQGEESMRRVAETIINRGAVRGMSFGDIVRQANQYTGYSSPGPAAVQAQQSPQMRAAAQRAWETALQPGDPTNGADHYFNPSVVNPGWQNSMLPRGNYGGHAYYASRPIPPNDLANAVASVLDVRPPTRPVALPRPRPASPMDRANQLFAGTAANASAARQPGLANSLGDYIGRQQSATSLTRPQQIDRVVTAAGAGQDRLLGSVLADYVRPKPAARMTTAQLRADNGQTRSTGITRQTQASIADLFAPRLAASAPKPTTAQIRADNGQTQPAPPPRAATAPRMTTAQLRADNGQTQTTPRRPGNTAAEQLASMFGSPAPTSQIPYAASSVNQNKDQSRLAPSQIGLPVMPRQPAAPTTRNVQQNNPEYQRMQERIRAGELALKGMTPNGQPMSRDAKVRYDQALADLAAQRQRLASIPQQITVQQTVRPPAAPAAPAPAPAPVAVTQPVPQPAAVAPVTQPSARPVPVAPAPGSVSTKPVMPVGWAADFGSTPSRGGSGARSLVGGSRGYSANGLTKSRG
jgi:hypothetical protein